MARGEASPVGTERWSANGYCYRKLEDRWELVHRLIAEEKIGRRLGENEYATFIDGDKSNLDPKNIVIRIRGVQSLKKRLTQVEVKIQELEAVRDELRSRLEVRDTLIYTQEN
jgi:hypothetical protein